MVDERLRRLERAAFENIGNIPAYINEHLRVHGIQPDLGPLITLKCQTHSYCHYRPNTFGIRESHDWEPEFRISSDLISWTPLPYNLFRVKKVEFPAPTSVEILLEGFYQHLSRLFGFSEHFNEIDFYFGSHMQNILSVISELRVLPKIADYPMVPETIPEMVELVNLQTDLIRGWDRIAGDGFSNIQLSYRNGFGFCLENFSPLTIFSFGELGGVENYRRTESPYSLWATNAHFGVTFNEFGYPVKTSREAIEQVLELPSAELSQFG